MQSFKLMFIRVFHEMKNGKDSLLSFLKADVKQYAHENLNALYTYIYVVEMKIYTEGCHIFLNRGIAFRRFRFSHMCFSVHF